jgi:hypothetical protein
MYNRLGGDMSAKVLKSQLPPDFADQVAAFHKAKLDHHNTIGVPAPTADYMVAQCVHRVPSDDPEVPDNYVINYEVIDDLPPPPTLAEKRTKLRMQVQTAEFEAYDAIMTPGKLRLLHVEVDEALQEKVHSDEQLAKIHKLEEVMSARKVIMHQAVRIGASIDDLDDAGIEAFKLGPLG